MWVNDLADAARQSGLTVWEDPGWKSRSHGAMTAVRAVVCHHTGDHSTNAWKVVRDGRSDLAGPLAQMTLERDGSVRILARGVSWHAGTGSWPSIGRNNGNAYALGIECVYNGSDITDAQRTAYPRLVAALCRHYGIAVGNVIGHKEWAPGRKVDPGNVDMPAFRRTVQAIVNGGSPAPSPAPAPAPSGAVLRRGSTGPAVSHLQAELNRQYASYSHLVVDGDFGPATEAVVREFQFRAHLTVDGVVGPATAAALHL